MESHKLYVGNLKHTVTEDDLKELFSEFGTIREVEVIGGKGFGFVTFETLEGAERAREILAGKEFEGRTLRVEDARPVFLSGERHPETML
jgi:RNA recognition motif-containing protein